MFASPFKEPLHIIWETLAAAKLEISVFLLAAGLHLLLFSTRAPSAHLKAKAKLGDDDRSQDSVVCKAVAIARGLKPLRAGAVKDTLRKELRSLLREQQVAPAELQAVLANVLENLSRGDLQLLGAVREAAGSPVTDLKLAQQLLRGYLSYKDRREFEVLFQQVESQYRGKKLPHGIGALAIQFALAGDNLEAAIARLRLDGGRFNGGSNWKLLEHLMTDFIPLIDDHSIQICFHRILDSVVKNEPEHCWDVLEHMEKRGCHPNNVTCSILLKGVQKDMKDDYLKQVMNVIDSRANKEMDEVLLGSLYEACIRCGQVKDLLAYVQKLREDTGMVSVRSAHTVGSIIRAYGADQDLAGVWATWNDMKAKNVLPSRITLGCMVEALASNNDPEGAYDVIQQALADPQTKGLVNAVTYSSVLKSFNHQKLFHRVWDVYDEMIREKVEFSVTTYNALLDVCARSGEISRAEPLLKEMAAQGITPNIITYGTVIKAYCSANRLDQAFEVFSDMQANTDLHPDEVTYNTLLDGCARYGSFERGLEVLADMKKAKVPPSNYTLSVIAKLANRSKKPKLAFQMVEELRQEFHIKLNMHVYNNLIQAATCDNDSFKAQEGMGDHFDNVDPLLLRQHHFMGLGKAHALSVVLLRTALGLKQEELTSGKGHDALHPTLVKALLLPLQWATAPLRGNNALQEEVIHDVLDFLSRHQQIPGDFCHLPRLTQEVQKALPNLSLPKSTVRQPKLSSSNSPKKAETTMAQPPPPRPAGRALQIFHTCEIVHRKLRIASNDYVIVSGEIGREGSCNRDDFRHVSFASRKCAHDLDVKIEIRMTSDQWEHVACKSRRFLVVNAELKGSMLDTTSVISGVLASPEARVRDTSGDTIACEAFAGGYSGWTQAMRCLTRNGFPFSHRLAIDNDPFAMEAFMKSHGFEASVGPERFDWGRNAIPENLFIYGDIMLHGWYHLFSNTAFDVMMLSPPCPPWSYASLQQGLLKEEGRLTLHGWGLAGLLKPKVVLMEMVNVMKDHCHWKLIRELILWFGYSLRFARNCNLAEVAPQHRERFIVIATLDEAELFPHLPATWPCTQRQTLESYLSIMNLTEPWLSQCTLSSDLLAIYLDPALLPKSLDQRGMNLKRSKKDVEQYRIKHPHGQFGCVMSNYTYGHLLPDVALKHAGLFGTLIALPTGLRFLSIPEILVLQTTLESCWLPDNHRISIRILGNSISTPHALLGLVNALAFLKEEVALEDIRELMMRLLSRRMTSRNIHWEVKHGGYAFSLIDDQIAPTLLMHPERVISVKSPIDMISFHAECGVNVFSAMSALLGDSMPSELHLLPAGNLEARVTLQKQMLVGEHDIQVFSSVPSALQISTEAFSVVCNQNEMIVVLTRCGPFVIRRDHGMTVEDVITMVDHAFSIRCTHLVGILGERHPKLMIVPNAVIALDVEGACDQMDIIDFLRTDTDDFGISFHGTFGVLRDFWEVLYKTSMLEIVSAMGWMIVTNFQDVIDSNINTLQLVRKPGALAVTCDDLLYCIAIHFFVTKIRSWLVLGESPAVRCKLKLWHIWIWDSLIDPSKSMQDFENAWSRISDFLHIRKPWRFVCQGKCMNPEWPVSEYVEVSEHGTPEITVAQCDNFQDLAHMEAENFEAALSVSLRMIVKADHPIPRCDITRFLQIESCEQDGFFKMCGDTKALRELFSIFGDIGVDKMLERCGWVAMCAIVSFDEPMTFEIVFVRLPNKRAVTVKFLKAILRSVLVTLGMPNQTDNADDVVLKMKLWGVVIFNARLPRMFPMQELMDVWDQSCTIIGEHFEVRLVSHVGVVNPDFALKHYSRCGANDVTTAVMTFVGSLKGGGPGDKMPSQFHDFNIQQKNGLASFLLSQGADLKESLTFIDSILKGAGGSAVSSIMGQKRVAKKWEGLTQLAMALNIQVPQIAQKLQHARSKAQKKFQHLSKALPANIPIESLILKQGF
eukprot:s2444_g3.t1